MTNQDIQALHMQNVAYRDVIVDLKTKIRDYDRKIKANEIEIGKHLNEMERQEIEAAGECTLCLGECDVHPR